MVRRLGDDNIFADPSSVEYTSGSGVYSAPTNCRYILVEAVGGGGGGSKGSLSNPSGFGGGGGGYFKKIYPAGVYSYSVGAGGASTTVQGTAGTDGTATTFGSDSAGAGLRGQVAVTGTGGLVVATGAISRIIGQEGLIGPNDFTSPGGASHFSRVPSYRYAGATVTKLDGNMGSGGGGVNENIARSGAGGRGNILIQEFYI